MASPALAVGNDQIGWFDVMAYDPQGTPFTYEGNPQDYNDYGDYVFLTDGTWQGGPAIPVTDACGIPGDTEHQNQMVDPQYPPFSLIASCNRHQDFDVCYNPELQLLPGETCYFKMNDAPGGYGDNTGELFVHYFRQN
ncbi:MAG: hypothetical protein QNJ47_05765 [Nostocaceae cyanobacterium]|nr:hypothetical protein [Nostocaceae cyanobacterium]